jgi:hypothetical protein
MTTSNSIAIVASGRVSAAGALRLRVEKASESRKNSFNRRKTDQGDARGQQYKRRRGDSQSGTTHDEPFWNGPRLRAPFAAQVIGQVTGDDAPDARSALASYAPVKAWHFLFDDSF